MYDNSSTTTNLLKWFEAHQGAKIIALYPTAKEATFRAFGQHRWYQSENMVGLAFFYPIVDHEQKRLLEMNLTKQNGLDNLPQRIDVHTTIELNKKQKSNYSQSH